MLDDQPIAQKKNEKDLGVHVSDNITPMSSTLIDHIYTNATTHNITSNVILNDFSDHFPVSVLIHNLKNKSTPAASMIRDYKSFKPEDFIVDLSEELDRVDFT